MKYVAGWATPTFTFDGDTLEVRTVTLWGAYQSYAIRLSRVDTPEKGQIGWAESRDYLHAVVAGQRLYCQPAATDVYGRAVCEVWVPYWDSFGRQQWLNVNNAVRWFVTLRRPAWLLARVLRARQLAVPSALPGLPLP